MFGQRHSQLSARTCRGFTLLELLMIIALLVILAALILPLFSSARAAGYRIKCASNLKQLGAAFYLYSQDYQGYWPSPGGLYGNRAYWSQSGSGGLNRYVNQQGVDSVWCCPLLTDWRGKFSPRTYSMNSYLRTKPRIDMQDVEYPSCISLLTGIDTARITRPKQTILLYEGIPFASGYEDCNSCEDQVQYVYRCANWSWTRGYSDQKMPHTIDSNKPWHGKVNNYLYCDGHVISRSPGKKTAGTLSTYKEMYEWYVDKDGFERIYSQKWAALVPRE